MSAIKSSNKNKSINSKKVSNTFSIVIANYNYADYVAQAIQTSLNQNYPDTAFEVIVVDDGSTDNSRQVITDIAAKNNNLRVVTQPNLGQAAAFYAGVNVAKYEWICFLDSDDYFKPEKLSVLNAFINEHNGDCDFICHNVDAIDEATQNNQDWFLRQNISGDFLSVDNAQGGYPYANPCGQVYKKSILQKIAPWLNLTEWQRGADNPMAWASLLVNGRVSYIHQSLAIYRIHANNFFIASTSNGLVPKVNWLERWPKLLGFLNYLNQGSKSAYSSPDDRDALLSRLDQFMHFWEKRLQQKPNIPLVSFITTCKNRLHHLKITLPRMVEQTNAEVIVVDYGCTEGTRDWVSKNYPQVKVVVVDDDAGWNVSRARNFGAAIATAPWLCFIDADIILQSDLANWGLENFNNGHYYLAFPISSSSAKGTVVCQAAAYKAVGGYDEAFVGWMPEDRDFYIRLTDAGFVQSAFSSSFISPIEHSDEYRQLGGVGQVHNTGQGMRVGMVYRLLIADMKKMTGSELDLDSRKNLMSNLINWTSKYEKSGLAKDSRFAVKLNAGMELYETTNVDRQLVYSLKRPQHIFRSQLLELQKKQVDIAKYNPVAVSQVAGEDKLVPHIHKIAMFHFGRSGSSVLADMLNQHPLMHWDNEIYEHQIKSIEKKLGYFKYGDEACRYDPIEVLKQRLQLYQTTNYGFEVKFNHLEHCDYKLSEYIENINNLGVDRYITLERKNILRKIVSSLVADKTNVWHVAGDKQGPKSMINIPFEAMRVERKDGSLLELLDHYSRHFNQLYSLLEQSNISLLKLTYEDDIEANPKLGFSKATEFLGLPLIDAKVRLNKTNPYPLNSIVENLDEVREYLKNSPYDWMPDA